MSTENKAEEKTAKDVKPYRKPVGKKARKAQRRKVALIDANLQANKAAANNEEL